jgi:hypothetical protein
MLPKAQREVGARREARPLTPPPFDSPSPSCVVPPVPVYGGISDDRISLVEGRRSSSSPGRGSETLAKPTTSVTISIVSVHNRACTNQLLISDQNHGGAVSCVLVTQPVSGFDLPLQGKQGGQSVQSSSASPWGGTTEMSDASHYRRANSSEGTGHSLP